MRWGRGMWLGCAVATIAVSLVLNGCTQLQTHDTLASFFEKQSPPPSPPGATTPSVTDNSAQQSNVVPREDDGRQPSRAVIEAPDTLPTDQFDK